MKASIRRVKDNNGRVIKKMLVLSSTSESESKKIDEIFGKKVERDGLIGQPKQAIAKLSDGYGQHYIRIDSN